MKKKNVLLIILFLFSLFSFAQDSKEDKKEQIRALKVGFITNELSLTTDEAAKFWPLYNAYDDRQYELKNRKMKAIKAKLSDDALEKMSEKDASALLAQMESVDNELYQARRKLINSLKDVLPATKILKLKKAEDDFKKKLLQQYRDKSK